ncbi:MAG: GNAT family N-acetyltransferase [Bacteroidia bacterium]|nr:GNAT family N-acetyltransferase [Bacteroidia bacterium]NND26327.1 GNAT family N-acetyltransferase [Flavobacteriaceae bacterium]MBT8278083.1 GNAT family N-acetyltransferase [Bacteroidia bacterium]NNK59595.1 GNAT family N-acetyltransferase [Flavobacteriaceae bacterium]NNL33880.1 GNAT family N-acetyltransferase [Flavobacteriaceae bacterium]
MSDASFLIREIEPKDNAKVEAIIKAIFPEFGMPLDGTAYADVETPRMYESYQGAKEVYFVLEENGQVVGGAGIKPLKNYEADVCELQKMYFTPSVRGKGYGRIMFNKCLDKAKALGYKKCYLESASQLKIAIQLYEKEGFKHLEQPLGFTGHYSCGVWMIKDL